MMVRGIVIRRIIGKRLFRVSRILSYGDDRCVNGLERECLGI